MPASQSNSSLVVLAGRTGSGKSAVLQQLAQNGFPVIDLEQLAQHSGSAFGHLPFNSPVSNMGFSKSLKERFDGLQYEPLVFTECKGSHFGNIALPGWFSEKLKQGYIIHFDVPAAVRVDHLTKTYVAIAVEDFIHAAAKLSGKIEPEKLYQIQTFLKAHMYADAITLLVAYYDSSVAYQYFIDRAQATIPVETIDPKMMAEKLTETLLQQHPLFLCNRR